VKYCAGGVIRVGGKNNVLVFWYPFTKAFSGNLKKKSYNKINEMH